MKYQKPALTIEQQADLLASRGLVCDRDLVVDKLRTVNYYRLSAYAYPFRKENQDQFKDGTTFRMVWDRYVFDRRLRLLLMDAIERIEIAVRTQLAYHHAHQYGPFAYAEDGESLPGLSAEKLRQFRRRVGEEFDKGHEHFVIAFRKKYPDSANLPVWMATEIMTIGNILTFFRGCHRRIKKSVASLFLVPDDVFDSWLLTLNTVRNICAHHSRMWNRVLGTKPFIPRRGKYPEWHSPVTVPNDRTFAVMSICRHCLKCVSPQTSWQNRVRALFTAYPTIPLAELGFPDGWERHAVWK